MSSDQLCHEVVGTPYAHSTLFPFQMYHIWWPFTSSSPSSCCILYENVDVDDIFAQHGLVPITAVRTKNQPSSGLQI